jgi:hypothetical protein
MTKLYLTRGQALSNYNLTETELDKLIKQGQVKTVIVAGNDQKQPCFYDDDLAAYVAERDISPEKFKHLKGNLLGMAEAGLRHGVTSSTVSRWASRGVLEIKGTDGLKKLVDEADVAYLAELGRAKKMRPGKKVFDQNK